MKTLPSLKRAPEEDELGLPVEEDQIAQPVEQELEVLRLRSDKYEIVITPDFNKKMELILIVVQDPAQSSG